MQNVHQPVESCRLSFFYCQYLYISLVYRHQNLVHRYQIFQSVDLQVMRAKVKGKLLQTQENIFAQFLLNPLPHRLHIWWVSCQDEITPRPIDLRRLIMRSGHQSILVSKLFWYSVCVIDIKLELVHWLSINIFGTTI